MTENLYYDVGIEIRVFCEKDIVKAARRKE